MRATFFTVKSSFLHSLIEEFDNQAKEKKSCGLIAAFLTSLFSVSG